jgi:hypothetical protein
MPETYRQEVVWERFILALLVGVNSILFCISLIWLAPYDEFTSFVMGRGFF